MTMKHLLILLLLLASGFLSFSQNDILEISEKKCFDYIIPQLEVYSDKIYSLLDKAIEENEHCSNITDTIIFVIRVLPIQGNYFVGGLSIFRIEDVYHSSLESESKGFFRYRNYMFIVYSQLNEDFHQFHWAFRKTEISDEVSFCTKEVVFEDFEKKTNLKLVVFILPISG